MSSETLTNRLAGETSPYLLQHAGNPVDWYPWGPEALRESREKDKPILLSIGYSACHWCHVMERESFEDRKTASLMNDLFVNIKVDREERPDLDHIYQTAIQVLGRNGGWPLTMFLTPDLKPFFGGTYFPPVDRYGMRAFPRILVDVARAYREQRGQVDRQAAEITEYLGEVDGGTGKAATDPLPSTFVRNAAAALTQRFDPDHGGFGDRPKFPNSTALELWLRQTDESDFRDRVAFTLTQMIAGGIYDQLGGGFHRYSTDEHWLVPHFEKMLYDNGLLLRLLAQAWTATGNPLFQTALRETADYVLREMCDPSGGFYSTQDADSEGVEGKFFVWDEQEIRAVVDTADADLVLRALGVSPVGNFEQSGKSVLHRPMTLSAAARMEGRTEDDAVAALSRARQQLFRARELRVHPHRDDKIIAGWNGLMIHGLATAGTAVNDQRYVDGAVRASEFVATQLTQNGHLLRTWRAGKARIPAFAEDYAFLAEGELALFEATGDPKHFRRGQSFVDTALDRFQSPDGGFFVTPSDGEPLIQRPRASYDNAVPSATSSLTHALLRLHAVSGDARYAEAADRALRCFQPVMSRNPFGYSYLLCAADAALAGVGSLVITGNADDPSRQALLEAARGRYLPNILVIPWTGVADAPPGLASLLQGKSEQAAAWLCRNGTCSRPAKTTDELMSLLT
jgi:uncharacterized protein YyaL (SSP411 family)